MSTYAPQGSAEALIEVADRNFGFVEGPRNNENPYAPLVGHANFQPWCASFVAACAKRAGVELPSTSAYTPTMANGFKKIGRYDKTPQRGSIVFFFWPNMGRIAHVGIVERVNADGSVSTIEGNTNSGGSRTGGMVTRLVRRSNIDGFGHPVFTAVAPPPEPKPEPAKEATPTPIKRSRQVQQRTKKPNPYAVPVLTRARPDLRASGRKTKDEVRYVQWAVGTTTDGDWGRITSQKVREFQASRKLTVDGQVGPKTLTEMAKVRR